MNKLEIKQEIQNLVDLYQEFHKVWIAFADIAGGDFDSPLAKASWDIFDAYLQSVEKLVGDEYKWIDWYIFENKCGKGKMTVEINGKSRLVDNIDKLVKIIRK
jgi:hypothetical protein